MGLTRPTHPTQHPEERQSPRDFGDLVSQLGEGDANVRRMAACALSEYPQAAAALGERLRQEDDLRVRDACFSSLALFGNADAAAALVPLLRSEDPSLRTGAIETLASMPSAVAPHVNALLTDTDPDVRIFTVNLLGELSHPHVRRWLLQVLKSETAVNVVAAALDVMAEVGGPEHHHVLASVRIRFADEPFIGFAVDMAVQRMAAMH